MPHTSIFTGPALVGTRIAQVVVEGGLWTATDQVPPTIFENQHTPFVSVRADSTS